MEMQKVNGEHWDSEIVLLGLIEIGYAAGGFIYNDKAGRFADGIQVITSPVVEIGDGWFRTRNTVYKVLKTAPSPELVSVSSEFAERMPTTHELARAMLAAKDVPLYAMRYEGDLDGEYTSMLTRISCIDYGFVKGAAVVVQEEQEIDIAELEDQLYQTKQDKALVELVKLSRDDVENGRVMSVEQAIGRLNRERKQVKIIELGK